jgi:hypothetical protein
MSPTGEVVDVKLELGAELSANEDLWSGTR